MLFWIKSVLHIESRETEFRFSPRRHSLFLCPFLLFILLIPQLGRAQDVSIKRELIANSAPVYMSPDSKSAIIDTLRVKGTIVDTYAKITSDGVAFYEIKMPSSNLFHKGYVYASYLETPEEKAVSRAKAKSAQPIEQPTEIDYDKVYRDYLKDYLQELKAIQKLYNTEGIKPNRPNFFSNPAFKIMAIILFIFFVFLWIIWIFLPFAIFGIKKRLDKIIELLKAQKGDYDE